MVGLQGHLLPVVLRPVLVHFGAAVLHLLPRRGRHRLLRLLAGSVVFVVLVVIVMALLGLLLIWEQSRSRERGGTAATRPAGTPQRTSPPRVPPAPLPPARPGPVRPGPLRSPRSFLPMAAAQRPRRTPAAGRRVTSAAREGTRRAAGDPRRARRRFSVPGAAPGAGREARAGKGAGPR